MKKLEQVLLRLTIFSWAVFALLMATEVGLLSARWRGQGIAFRWQVWLLAGTVLVAAYDSISDVRCRCCGSKDNLSVLGWFTSREQLCSPCLTWDPGVERAAEYNELIKALKS